MGHDDPTPIGTERIRSRRIRDLIGESTGYVLPMGAVISLCVVGFCYLFNRVENNERESSDRRAALSLRLEGMEKDIVLLRSDAMHDRETLQEIKESLREISSKLDALRGPR